MMSGEVDRRKFAQLVDVVSCFDLADRAAFGAHDQRIGNSALRGEPDASE